MLCCGNREQFNRSRSTKLNEISRTRKVLHLSAGGAGKVTAVRLPDCLLFQWGLLVITFLQYFNFLFLYFKR